MLHLHTLSPQETDPHILPTETFWNSTTLSCHFCCWERTAVSQPPRSGLSEQCKESITKAAGAHPCHAPLETMFCIHAKKDFSCFDEMMICNGKNSKTRSPQGCYSLLFLTDWRYVLSNTSS